MNKYQSAFNDLLRYLDFNTSLISWTLIKEAVAKTVPKKPTDIYETHGFHCPSCNTPVSKNTIDAFGKKLSVCHCGQQLDWSDK